MKFTFEYLRNIFYHNKKYFDSTHVRSKGCTWNIFLSDRSDGKTMDCKIQAIIHFLLYDYAHVYARRNDTELTTIMKQSYFKKLIRIYPIINKWMDFKYDEIGVQAKLKEESEDRYRYIVYFLALSMSSKLKSQIEDERIMYVDLDEYIPLDGRYLKNEMIYCCELYKTIDRDRDKVQFSFFGNKITSFNPAFDFWNLKLEINDAKVRYYNNNTIAVQIYHSNLLQDERNKSNFQKSIENTAYNEYAQGGILQQFDLITMSPKNAQFYISFKSCKGEGSIWIKDSYYIISTKKYGQDVLITDTNYNVNRPCIHCLAGNVSKIFKSAYRYNLIAYENERAFYIFEPILRKINLN